MERPFSDEVTLTFKLFQSTLPMQGATQGARNTSARANISIRAPRAGSDNGSKVACLSVCNFNPRSPCGERRSHPVPAAQQGGISIHAPRAGSDLIYSAVVCNPGSKISIHAPRAGSDRCPRWRIRRKRPISIHAPRAGSDPAVEAAIIQSLKDFNPRSPCGERLLPERRHDRNQSISIHAPRAGSDASRLIIFSHAKRFQSTLPVRGATVEPCTDLCRNCYFNPRSPCGERHLCAGISA